jgi:hypothetical protein
MDLFVGSCKEPRILGINNVRARTPEVEVNTTFTFQKVLTTLAKHDVKAVVLWSIIAIAGEVIETATAMKGVVVTPPLHRVISCPGVEELAAIGTRNLVVLGVPMQLSRVQVKVRAQATPPITSTASVMVVAIVSMVRLISSLSFARIPLT